MVKVKSFYEVFLVIFNAATFASCSFSSSRRRRLLNIMCSTGLDECVGLCILVQLKDLSCYYPIKQILRFFFSVCYHYYCFHYHYYRYNTS